MQPAKKFSLISITVVILLPLFFYACSDNSPTGPDASDFDRQAMLVNWADNIIIPAYTDFSDYTARLHAAAEAFTAAPGQETLDTLRDSWEIAYIVFQRVSLFETGPGEAVMLRNFLNIYPATTKPTDTDPPNPDNITSNIESGTYNLELSSLNSSQGFPALDYLLYGLSENDADILESYTTGTYAANYRLYLTDLTSRINAMTEQVLSEWTNSYRDQFTNNSEKGKNASVDMVVNNYILYYERFLRAGKVGIPVGVLRPVYDRELLIPQSARTEAYYRGDLSKRLLLEALSAVQDFFNGKHYGSTQTGESLNTYLDYLNTMKPNDEGIKIINSTIINNQFDSARDTIQLLNDNFTEQVDSDPVPMLKAYDELQKNVIYLKTDMAEAMGIEISYYDNDGD